MPVQADRWWAPQGLLSLGWAGSWPITLQKRQTSPQYQEKNALDLLFCQFLPSRFVPDSRSLRTTTSDAFFLAGCGRFVSDTGSMTEHKHQRLCRAGAVSQLQEPLQGCASHSGAGGRMHRDNCTGASLGLRAAPTVGGKHGGVGQDQAETKLSTRKDRATRNSRNISPPKERLHLA